MRLQYCKETNDNISLTIIFIGLLVNRKEYGIQSE